MKLTDQRNCYKKINEVTTFVFNGAPHLSSENATFNSITPEFKSLYKPYVDLPIGNVSVISYRK